ncbi:hypothetical protein J5J10_08260 [Ciceribacter sp. L1K23]|uniref:hypothetical protein n=1 Tax=Ciceribacter sp. L1K23 TaxID=2820276 RepID=UPI001B81F7F0|nr:hypothetical protein [Ciceribacter sp. L1K23]MBR0555674.1 hypothetical protein [Ciceribacter sp. L1K23]
MQTALIIMTILGCDDAVSQCDYIDSPRERWVSVELCHAASEKLLNGFTNAGYPTVIAVCQEPEPAPVTAEATPAPETQDTADATPTAPSPAQKGLAARALDTVRLAIPGKEKVKMVFEAPLHVISDSYSWVARKVGQ